MRGLTIDAVTPGSPADQAAINAGERLISINGNTVRDIIDYSWLSLDDELELVVEDPSGNRRSVNPDRSSGEPPGLLFSPPEPKRCGNNCIFCFIHQLPKGLRPPLYIKDEDYRLSFLHGTYVTLSNIKSSELRRIVRLRLSPLYISVHTTDPELRETMLGKRGIPPVLNQLRLLANARIQMHTQIVLCPFINDGFHLERTVSELASLYPSVRSIAIVPLGLTSHRRGLPDLQSVDRDYAAGFIEKWLPEMRKINKRLGDAFLQIADEFFLKAGHPFPSLKEYGDLPQWENGVGMVPCFMKEAASVLKKARPFHNNITATVVTGRSANPFVEEFLANLSEITGCRLKAQPVQNLLFGESVTVTGLVCGSDIIRALDSKPIGDFLLIPDVMLKEGEGLFLDNLSVADLSMKLLTSVIRFEPTPAGLYRLLLLLVKKHKNKMAVELPAF